MQLLLPPHLSGFMQHKPWLLSSMLMKIAQFSTFSTFTHFAGPVDKSSRKASNVSPVDGEYFWQPTMRSMSPHATSHGWARCHFLVMLPSKSTAIFRMWIQGTEWMTEAEIMVHAENLAFEDHDHPNPFISMRNTQPRITTNMPKVIVASSVDQEMWVGWRKRSREGSIVEVNVSVDR